MTDSPDALPPWRLLGPHRMGSLSVGLTCIAFICVPVMTVAAGVDSELLGSVAALALCLVALRVFVVSRHIVAADKPWLARSCQVALVVRVLLATIIYCGPWDRHLLAPDQLGYDNFPQFLAYSWSTGEPVGIPQELFGQRWGYYNLVAAEFYVFGLAPLVARIFNAFAGGLIVVYTYRLTEAVFGKAAARLAALFATFVPSLVLWSSLNMRDIWLALAVVICLFHAMRLRHAFSWGSIATIGATLLWIHSMRPYLVFVMGVGLIAAVFLTRGRAFTRDIVIALALLSLLLTLHFAAGLGKEGTELLDLERLSQQRERLARGDVGRSGYLGEADLSSPGNIVLFLPVALAYFLLSPFPWDLTLSRLMVVPDLIVWYWLLPYAIRAAVGAWRDRSRVPLSLLFPALVITVAYALGTSNIGLAYRYRAQIVPIFLAFAAGGYMSRRAALARRASAEPALPAYAR